MKKTIFTILLWGILVLGLTGCASGEIIDEQVAPTEIEGISMSVKVPSLTDKGVTIIIKDINGKGKYVYGTEFRVDKSENGKWYKVKETANNCGFNQMAYYVDDDGLLEFEQNWECMYGKLEKGTYRLVKDTFLETDKAITDSDHKYFSVEFTIK